MRDIDLGPDDYRTPPGKPAPMFLPGAGSRVATWLVVLFFCIGVAVSVDYMFGPAIRASARFITDLVFG